MKEKTHPKRGRKFNVRKDQCKFCSVIFSSKKNLIMHVDIVHPVEKSFKCEICEYSSSDDTLLKRHVASGHKRKNVLVCMGICKENLTQQSKLRAHINRLHIVDLESTARSQILKCGTCNSRFIDNSHLKIHKKLAHEGKKQFKCETCNFLSKTEKDLEAHVNMLHKLQSNSSLTAHVNHQYLTELPFMNKCQLCNKVFNGQVSLGIHLTFIPMQVVPMFDHQGNSKGKTLAQKEVLRDFLR